MLDLSGVVLLFPNDKNTAGVKSMSKPNNSVSPLRQRMIEDMTMRKLNQKTQDAYIRNVRELAEYLGYSSHRATT